jgi:hypothetical protein
MNAPDPIIPVERITIEAQMVGIFLDEAFNGFAALLVSLFKELPALTARAEFT